MERPALSVQLYSLRDRLDDTAGTLASMASLGFTAVEPYGLAGWADRLAPSLAASGLTAPTAHASLLAGDVDEVLNAAELLGTRTVFDPMVPEDRWTTREDVAAVAGALNAVAARAADRGITVGYHNHWWELERLIDGVPALEVFAEHLDDGVVLELDTYWAAVGGQDPVALLQRLGSRVVAMHIKDGPITRETSSQLPAGGGAMPIAEILAAAPAARPVLEFDDYSGDIIEGIAASKATVDRLLSAR